MLEYMGRVLHEGGAEVAVSDAGPFYVSVTAVLEADVRFRAVVAGGGGVCAGARGFLKGEGGVYDLGDGGDGGAAQRVAGPGGYDVLACPPQGYVCVEVRGGGRLEVEGGDEVEVIAVMAEAKISVCVVEEGKGEEGRAGGGGRAVGDEGQAGVRGGASEGGGGGGGGGEMNQHDALEKAVVKVMSSIVAAASGAGDRASGAGDRAEGRHDAARGDPGVPFPGKGTPDMSLRMVPVASPVQEEEEGGEGAEAWGVQAGRLAGRATPPVAVHVALEGGRGEGWLPGAGEYSVSLTIVDSSSSAPPLQILRVSIGEVDAVGWDPAISLDLPPSAWRDAEGGVLSITLFFTAQLP